MGELIMMVRQPLPKSLGLLGRAGNLGLCAFGSGGHQGRSKRSKFMTLDQAAAKSFTNFSSPSSQP